MQTPANGRVSLKVSIISGLVIYLLGRWEKIKFSRKAQRWSEKSEKNWFLYSICCCDVRMAALFHSSLIFRFSFVWQDKAVDLANIHSTFETPLNCCDDDGKRCASLGASVIWVRTLWQIEPFSTDSSVPRKCFKQFLFRHGRANHRRWKNAKPIFGDVFFLLIFRFYSSIINNMLYVFFYYNLQSNHW